MKRILLSLILLLVFVLSSHAQDKLIKRNGRILEGKVTEVGVKEIRYQTSQDPNSAKFVIRKAELERIEFANGEVFVISERAPVKKEEPARRSYGTDYGRNILTISPFKALDSGPGLGFSYERLVGENQYVGIILPVAFIFKEYSVYSSSIDLSNHYYTNLYMSPGVKIYPFGQRKVTYAVGPNIMLGFNKDRDSRYVPTGTTGYYDYEERNSFRLGLIINNYLNFQITSKINLGLNGGLGMRYLDRASSSSNYYNDGMRVTGEFAFNFGFRF
jgi:hypothetical protein